MSYNSIWSHISSSDIDILLITVKYNSDKKWFTTLDLLVCIALFFNQSNQIYMNNINVSKLFKTLWYKTKNSWIIIDLSQVKKVLFYLYGVLCES